MLTGTALTVTFSGDASAKWATSTGKTGAVVVSCAK